MTVQDSTIPLPSGFGFDTPVPTGLAGTLNIAAPSLSSQGFQTIGLGVSDLTGSAASVVAYSVDIKPGVTLQAENIILGATNSINLEPGAQILALALPGDAGQAAFISPGTLSIGANAVVHASDAVNLQVASISLDPTATIKADHSALNLTGSTITITGSQAVTSSGPSGLFLTATQWNSLADSFDDISLITSIQSSPRSGTVVFNGLSNTDLLAAIKDTLTIDTGLVTTRVNGVDTGSVVTLTAQNIVLQNTSGVSSLVSGSRGTGNITFQAQGMGVGKGSTSFDGFRTVNVNAANDLTFRGAGEVPQGGTFRAAGVLGTGGADLNIVAARVTTAPYMQPAGTDPTTGAALTPVYTAADFKVDAGAGTVNITPGTGIAGTTAAPGGTLAITAGEIDISTTVEVPSGQIELTATASPASTGSITIGSGGQLLAQGTPYAPGGVVFLASTGTNTSGNTIKNAITIDPAALIDVSAGAEGDAGSISLYAPIGGVALGAYNPTYNNLRGQAAGGRGGSFSMVTNNNLDIISGINYFSALNSKLNTGGFTNALTIEASTGNVTIAYGQKVVGQSVTVTANAGSIYLPGTITASQNGSVALYAQDDLSLTDPQNPALTGLISAPGGTVTLAVETGALNLAGGTIDVSGGGTVTFQAPLTENGVPANFATGTGSFSQAPGLNMTLNGIVKGASNVYVEAIEEYVYSSASPIVIDSTAFSTIQSNLYSTSIPYSFAQSAGNLITQLLNRLTDGNGSALTPYTYNAATNSGTGTFHLQPGVLIENTGIVNAGVTTGGDITVSSTWDLSPSALNWRFGSGNEPGTLTLRAAGNLNINANICRSPDEYWQSQDQHRAALLEYQPRCRGEHREREPHGGHTGERGRREPGETSPSAQDERRLYGDRGPSGSPPAEIRSSMILVTGDTIPPLLQYRHLLGRDPGDVQGSLTLSGGVIQSSTGDIDVNIGGSLTLGWDSTDSILGGIRTTGEASVPSITNYASYGNGGGISLDVVGDVDGAGRCPRMCG